MAAQIPRLAGGGGGRARIFLTDAAQLRRHRHGRSAEPGFTKSPVG